jgi:hypothetical protein
MKYLCISMKTLFAYYQNLRAFCEGVGLFIFLQEFRNWRQLFECSVLCYNAEFIQRLDERCTEIWLRTLRMM